MNEFFSFIIFIRPMQNIFTSENFTDVNRAFLYGDAVKVSFFVRNSSLIMAEESYFYLMASMRKMRMNIPLSYTLEYFQNLFTEEILNRGAENGIINFLVYRDVDAQTLQKSGVSFYFDFKELNDVLSIQRDFELDIIKEIFVNSSLLSNIRVHSPENVYAEIYAQENDLDEVILLNAHKRIARTISGNLLFLQEGKVKLAKQTEGALISPLMENFITFLHKNNLAEVDQVEMIAFESQKAEEILLISDEKGLFSVTKIRNRTFAKSTFESWISQWKHSFTIIND